MFSKRGLAGGLARRFIQIKKPMTATAGKPAR